MRQCRRLVTGSMPAYTATRSAPLGRASIDPFVRLCPGPERVAVTSNLSHSHHV